MFPDYKCFSNFTSLNNSIFISLPFLFLSLIFSFLIQFFQLFWLSMACQLKTLLMLLVFLLISNLQHCVNGRPQVPCLFIFGDSLSDNGNNNNLVTMAKVNYQPYGIDFPAGPTGRFTNGRNIGDIIGMQFTLFYINWCMLLSHKFFFLIIFWSNHYPFWSIWFQT